MARGFTEGMRTNRWPEGFVATVATTSRDAWTWVAAAAAGTGFCIYQVNELMAAGGVVFGLLFLVVPVWLIEVAAMRVGGRVDVVKEGAEGRFFVGVGRVGWTCRFRWKEVRDVQHLVTPARAKQVEEHVIWVDLGEGQVVIFGSLVDNAGREYLIDAIRAGMRG